MHKKTLSVSRKKPPKNINRGRSRTDDLDGWREHTPARTGLRAKRESDLQGIAEADWLDDGVVSLL